MITRITSQFRLFILFVFSLILFHASSVMASSPPANFEQAKNLMRMVYHDRPVTSYCGCNIRWNRNTGSSGQIDLASCGYEMRSPNSQNMQTRARRVEVEHVFPASWMIEQFQCGSRNDCRKNSREFNFAEADLVGLIPTVGEVNADRSNYRFDMIQGPATQYGSCDFKVDFANQRAEPGDHIKGKIARIHFYYADRYGFRLSQQQQRLMSAWDRQFQVSSWELERNRRIINLQGNGNPFVTGEKSWNLSTGRAQMVSGAQSAQKSTPTPSSVSASEASAPAIIGNSNSKIYHIQGRCPSFNSVSQRNRVSFSTQREAEAAGYRIAKNCR